MTIEEIREKLEELDLQIIASVGTARSMFIEALNLAKEGHFEEAEAKVAEADELFAQGHDAHHDILGLQGQGIELPFDLMLVHAEDQMMSAECFRLVATELIEIYKNKARRISRFAGDSQDCIFHSIGTLQN